MPRISKPLRPLLAALALAGGAAAQESGTALRQGGLLGPRKPEPGAERESVQRGLEWLARHQEPDGRWDTDGFMNREALADGPRCDGGGSAWFDIGVTGLAALVFLADGNSTVEGQYAETLRRAVAWLRSVQDPRSGLLHAGAGDKSVAYGHAIATTALAEALFYGPDDPGLTEAVTQASEWIVSMQNPGLGWRYDTEPPPDGTNDTSVTGWMSQALLTAQQAGVRVPVDFGAGALSWLDQVTQGDSGRTGYDGRGGLPSRLGERALRFPPEKSEATTAVSLLCRLQLADWWAWESWAEHPQHALLQKQVDLLLAKIPAWMPEDGAVDYYYWYYATHALRQWGDPAWGRWWPPIRDVLIAHQRGDGNFAGSWDAVDPWGEDGGRIYSTAMCLLSLQAGHRYRRVIELEPARTRAVARRRNTPPLLIRAEGGAGERAQALARALEWLRANQRADGSWPKDEVPEPDAGAGLRPGRVGVTALAVLALLQGAPTPDGAAAAAASAGLEWLAGSQDAGGAFGVGRVTAGPLDQALATWALAEACFRCGGSGTGSTRHVVALRRALRALRRGAPDLPDAGGNPEALGWIALALRAAAEAGAESDDQKFKDIDSWYYDQLDRATGRIRTQSDNLVLVAQAALWRLLRVDLDAVREKTRIPLYSVLRLQVDLMLEQRAAADPAFLYFATCALKRWGGGHYTEWNAAVEPALLRQQRTDGTEAGSWDPAAAGLGSGGRVETTCLCALILAADAQHREIFPAR